MTEATIRKHALGILEHTGWVCWNPPKAAKYQSQDIFGVFDLVCRRGGESRYIQLTTNHNVAARVHKVTSFLGTYRILGKNEVWGYDQKHRRFKVVSLEHTGSRSTTDYIQL